MKKICSECNTENELHYLYCKNCGSPLNGDEPVFKSQNAAPVQNPYAAYQPEHKAYTAASAAATPTSVEGIDKQDFITFIGKNGENIFSKFVRMEYSGSKVSWCWPAAILTFFFGFLGSAIWFFYRKMYKLAVILMAIGIVFTVSQTVLTYNTQIAFGEQILGSFSDIMDEFEFDNTANEVIEDIEQAPSKNLDLVLSAIARILSSVETYVGTALVGMFAMYFYKKHCTKKIAAYKASNVDPQYYSYCLGLVGGTSSGMLALGIIITALVQTVADSPSIITLLGGFNL